MTRLLVALGRPLGIMCLAEDACRSCHPAGKGAKLSTSQMRPRAIAAVGTAESFMSSSVFGQQTRTCDGHRSDWNTATTLRCRGLVVRCKDYDILLYVVVFGALVEPQPGASVNTIPPPPISACLFDLMGYQQADGMCSATTQHVPCCLREIRTTCRDPWTRRSPVFS